VFPSNERKIARWARAALDSLAQNGANITILQAELQQSKLNLQEKEKYLNEYEPRGLSPWLI